ncbi:MAG: S66 peptidase family protein [Candidatus Micrarchaeales archaeon]
MPKQTTREFVKPQRLRPGDEVAVIADSDGDAAGKLRPVFRRGVNNLEQLLGLQVKEYPTTKMSSAYLHNHPDIRARDINDAFDDRDIKAVFSAVGGDNSVLSLPYLNMKVIHSNPKIIMGLSDSTAPITAIHYKANLVTYYGLSVMSDFAQMRQLPEESIRHVKDMFFDPKETYEYKQYDYQYAYRPGTSWALKGRTANTDWRKLQGNSPVRGELFGGCIDVLEFMKATPFWPPKEFFNGKILLFETADDDRWSPEQVKFSLRNYGSQGILSNINGIVFGKLSMYSEKERKKLEKGMLMVASEFERSDLPIISNVDFGHTQPGSIVPNGIKAEIDPEKMIFRLLEPTVR